MLAKKERLSVRDISTLERGRSVFGACLSLRFLPAGETKFSVSVSKKVAKSAVARNRIRRRVYAALRDSKKSVRKSAFVMVMPKKECSTLPLPLMRREIESLFSKAGLLDK